MNKRTVGNCSLKKNNSYFIYVDKIDDEILETIIECINVFVFKYATHRNKLSLSYDYLKDGSVSITSKEYEIFSKSNNDGYNGFIIKENNYIVIENSYSLFIEVYDEMGFKSLFNETSRMERRITTVNIII